MHLQLIRGIRIILYAWSFAFAGVEHAAGFIAYVG